MRRQRVAVEKAFQEGITKAKLVLRRIPLGTDRNHNRSVLHTTDDNTDECDLYNICTRNEGNRDLACWVSLFRYWLFSDVVPGLYIEKGWVHEGIDYNFTPPPEDKPAEPDVEEDEGTLSFIKTFKFEVFYLYKFCSPLC